METTTKTQETEQRERVVTNKSQEKKTNNKSHPLINVPQWNTMFKIIKSLPFCPLYHPGPTSLAIPHNQCSPSPSFSHSPISNPFLSYTGLFGPSLSIIQYFPITHLTIQLSLYNQQMLPNFSMKSHYSYPALYTNWYSSWTSFTRST